MQRVTCLIYLQTCQVGLESQSLQVGHSAQVSADHEFVHWQKRNIHAPLARPSPSLSCVAIVWTFAIALGVSDLFHSVTPKQCPFPELFETLYPFGTIDHIIPYL